MFGRFLCFVSFLAVVLVGGCQERDATHSEFTVRDSAGIEIVESSAPLLGTDAWTISGEPLLQIGAVEGDEPYLLGRLTNSGTNWGKVFRTEGGQIVVCNGMDSTIRFFDAVGHFLKQVGGRGEGPSEFSNIWSCAPTEDGFVVFGYALKAAWFDDRGELLRTARFPTVAGGRRTDIRGLFGDGAALLSGYGSQSHETGPGVHTWSEGLFVASADGDSVAPSLTTNSYTMASDGELSLNQQFGPSGQVLTTGDSILYGWPEDYSIGVYERDGSLTRSIRRTWEPLPVTEEDIEWWEDFRLNIDSLMGRPTSPSLAEARRKQNDLMIYPDHHAPFDKILVDRVGYIWVRQQHPRMEYFFNTYALRFPYNLAWDIFDSEGRWLTSLLMPTGLEVHDIGEDYILGVWKDEMDVEYVRMYSLDRTG